MLRTLVAKKFTGPVTFLHYARTPPTCPYRAELAALAAANVHRPAAVLHPRRRRNPGEHFTAAHLEDIDGFADADLFVCGPPALMDAVTAHVTDAGLTNNVHSEGIRARRPDRGRPTNPSPANLSFTRPGSNATNDGRTILDQADRRPQTRIRLPDGHLLSCTRGQKTGCTRNVLTGELNTEADAQIQICVNAPVGDVDIEL